MNERRLAITREEETFLLGRLDGEECSGAFLPAEYLGRLRQVRQAIGIRFEVLGIHNPPDALKNLLGIIDVLTTAHAEQMRVENAAPTAGDIEAFETAERELKEAVEALNNFPGPPDPPKKA